MIEVLQNNKWGCAGFDGVKDVVCGIPSLAGDAR